AAHLARRRFPPSRPKAFDWFSMRNSVSFDFKKKNEKIKVGEAGAVIAAGHAVPRDGTCPPKFRPPRPGGRPKKEETPP
ncbi:MAG: hypothetical protein V4789_16490, partial [Burkholderia gladioli]